MDYENDPNYTNVIEKDLQLIKKKSIRLIRLTNVIKFSTMRTDWFAVYDNLYIRRYRGEGFKRDKVIAMKRYLDEMFSQEVANNVIERYDNRNFMFADIMSMSMFQAKLKQIKTK